MAQANAADVPQKLWLTIAEPPGSLAPTGDPFREGAVVEPGIALPGFRSHFRDVPEWEDYSIAIRFDLLDGLPVPVSVAIELRRGAKVRRFPAHKVRGLLSQLVPLVAERWREQIAVASSASRYVRYDAVPPDPLRRKNAVPDDEIEAVAAAWHDGMAAGQAANLYAFVRARVSGLDSRSTYNRRLGEARRRGLIPPPASAQSPG